jgi:hypothetical protein
MHDTQTMAGVLSLILHDPSGRVMARREVHNLVTDAGRALVAELFAGKRIGALRARLVVGTGATPPSADNTKLEGEVDYVDVTESHIRVAGPRVSLTERLPEREQVQALREAGISLAIGTDPPVLYNRVVFDVVNKAPNMQMTLTWNVDFGGGK